MRGGFGKEIADLEPALAVFGEFKWRAEGNVAARDALAVHLGEGGFGVPRVDVRRSALGEDVNDGFRLAGEMGGARGEWAGDDVGVGLGGDAVAGVEQVGERERADAHAHAIEKLAAGQEIVGQVGGDAVAGGVFGGLGMGRHGGGEGLGGRGFFDLARRRRGGGMVSDNLITALAKINIDANLSNRERQPV